MFIVMMSRILTEYEYSIDLLCNAWSWVSQVQALFYLFIFLFCFLPCLSPFLFDADHGLGPIPFGFPSFSFLRIYTPSENHPQNVFFSPFSSSLPLLLLCYYYFLGSFIVIIILLFSPLLLSLLPSTLTTNTSHKLSFRGFSFSPLSSKVWYIFNNIPLPRSFLWLYPEGNWQQKTFQLLSTASLIPHSLQPHIHLPLFIHEYFLHPIFPPFLPSLRSTSPFQLQLQHWYSTLFIRLLSSIHTHFPPTNLHSLFLLSQLATTRQDSDIIKVQAHSLAAHFFFPPLLS